jgi:hypothetical protein
MVAADTPLGPIGFQGVSPAAAWAKYRRAPGTVSSASRSRMAASRTATMCVPCRLPPLGRESRIVEDSVEDRIGKRIVGELTHRERGPHDVVELHPHFLSLGCVDADDD